MEKNIESKMGEMREKKVIEKKSEKVKVIENNGVYLNNFFFLVVK